MIGIPRATTILKLFVVLAAMAVTATYRIGSISAAPHEMRIRVDCHSESAIDRDLCRDTSDAVRRGLESIVVGSDQLLVDVMRQPAGSANIMRSAHADQVLLIDLSHDDGICVASIMHQDARWPQLRSQRRVEVQSPRSIPSEVARASLAMIGSLGRVRRASPGAIVVEFPLQASIVRASQRTGLTTGALVELIPMDGLGESDTSPAGVGVFQIREIGKTRILAAPLDQHAARVLVHVRENREAWIVRRMIACQESLEVRALNVFQIGVPGLVVYLRPNGKASDPGHDSTRLGACMGFTDGNGCLKIDLDGRPECRPAFIYVKNRYLERYQPFIVGRDTTVTIQIPSLVPDIEARLARTRITDDLADGAFLADSLIRQFAAAVKAQDIPEAEKVLMNSRRHATRLSVLPVAVGESDFRDHLQQTRNALDVAAMERSLTELKVRQRRQQASAAFAATDWSLLEQTLEELANMYPVGSVQRTGYELRVHALRQAIDIPSSELALRQRMYQTLEVKNPRIFFDGWEKTRTDVGKLLELNDCLTLLRVRHNLPRWVQLIEREAQRIQGELAVSGGITYKERDELNARLAGLAQALKVEIPNIGALLDASIRKHGLFRTPSAGDDIFGGQPSSSR